MAIMGGAILPKLMGAVADKYDLSRGFIVPLLCFMRSSQLMVSCGRDSAVTRLCTVCRLQAGIRL